MKKEQRFLGAIDVYLWADSEKEDREMLQAFCDKMKKDKDNHAAPIALHSAPYGSLSVTKINHK